MELCPGIDYHRLNQLRYDLDELRGHALPERDGRRCLSAYRQVLKVAMLFVRFHQRPGGPFANSLSHHRPDANFQPDSKLEAAMHKADDATRKIIELPEATWNCCTTLVNE